MFLSHRRKTNPVSRRATSIAVITLLYSVGFTHQVLAEPPETDSSGQQPADSIDRADVKTVILRLGQKEYEARASSPAYEGDTGLFHMSTAYTLPRGRVSISLFRDNLDRDPKDEDISIHGLSLACGVTSRLEVFGNFGLQNRIDADALFQQGFVNDFPLVATPWETGIGDLRLGAKYKLLDDYRGDPLAVGLRGSLKLPTADTSKGLGTGKTSLSVDLLLSKTIARHLADLHASLGYKLNGNPVGVRVGDAFKWALGVDVLTHWPLQFQAEVTTAAYSKADVKQTNPIDLVVGFLIWIRPGLFVRPAVSWNLGFDDHGLGSSSASYMGRHVSIGYHPGTPGREIYVAPPPPSPPPPNRPPKVRCRTEKSTVVRGEPTRCWAEAEDLDGDPLTYEWHADAGRVIGSGSEVCFDSAGLSTPTAVTIDVIVSDGRGGRDTSQCQVDVVVPPEARGPVQGLGLTSPWVIHSYRAQEDVDVPAFCRTPKTFLEKLFESITAPRSNAAARCFAQPVQNPLLNDAAMSQFSCPEGAETSPEGRITESYQATVWTEFRPGGTHDFDVLAFARVYRIQGTKLYALPEPSGLDVTPRDVGERLQNLRDIGERIEGLQKQCRSRGGRP